MLVKLTPGVNFINGTICSFYAQRYQKGKKTVKLTMSFCAVYEQLRCVPIPKAQKEIQLIVSF